MVFYSIKSTDRVFHFFHCKIRQRMNKDYERQFASPEEARAQGYRMCSCCSPVGVRLRKEQAAIRSFCLKNDISYQLEVDQLHIRTPHSEWRIIADERPGNYKKLFLYHKNTLGKLEQTPSPIPGYHFQEVRRRNIMDYLKYIVEHDCFRVREREKMKKRQESMWNLWQNTWKYQIGRCNKRISANQLYSILDDVHF